MSAHTATPFEVVSVLEPPGIRLLVSGELDMATVPRLAEALRALERDRDRPIELDLSRLAFIDASGLHAILAASRRAHRQGRRFVVARPTAQILRLFELSGIERSLELAELPERLPVSRRAGRRPIVQAPAAIASPEP